MQFFQYRKYFLPIALVFVVLLGAGSYLLLGSRAQKPIAQPSPSNIVLASPTPTPTPSPSPPITSSPTPTQTASPVLLPATTDQPTIDWRYIGVFQDSAVNVTTLKLKDGRYVAYYSSGQPDTGRKKPNRAFSTDGLTWTPDKDWACPDLCDRPDGQPSLPHRDHLTLKDGRFRTYIKNSDGVISYISENGLDWKKEEGIRLTVDPTLETEQGSSALIDWSAIYLPDGKVRAYYQGQRKSTSGSDCGSCYVILSAISSDDGLTFTREGLRLDPKEVGQVFSTHGGYGFSDPIVVAINGGYRLFFGDYAGPIASAFSSDGLKFNFEGPLPIWGANPNAMKLPDERVLVLAGQGQGPQSKVCPGVEKCPENYNLEHMLVSESLPVTIKATKWDNGTNKATIEVDGARGQKVDLKIVEGTGMFCKYDSATQRNIWEPLCYFDKNQYKFEPSSGTVPFKSTLSRSVDPATAHSSEHTLLITATVDGKDVAGAVRCIGRSLEFSGDPYCK